MEIAVSNKTYNFDEGDNDSPTIIMGGLTYKLFYPVVEDIERIQKLKTDEEINDVIYSFVKKTNDNDPEFKETLKKQSIKVLVKFTEMVKTEFGLSELEK